MAPHLPVVRQFGRQVGDAVQHALAQGPDAPLQGEGVLEVGGQPVYPDFTSLVTVGATGIYRRDDGRYTFGCARHELRALWGAPEPHWLRGVRCIVCHAEEMAEDERVMFREELRHG